jgi:hypothetical protein
VVCYTQGIELQVVKYNGGVKEDCSAMVTIRAETEIIKQTSHSHAPDWGRCKALECVEKVKETATTSHESTSSIIRSQVASTSSETYVKLPKKVTLKRRIERVRKQHLPPEPNTLENLQEIQEKFTRYKDGERWLLHYDYDSETKLMIFCTDDHFRRLSRSEYWICDGTFKSVPNIICQIYTIHIIINNQWFPVVIALMKRKTKELYMELFQVLKEEVRTRFNRQLKPSYISTDYESAVFFSNYRVIPGHTTCWMPIPLQPGIMEKTAG